MKKKILILLSGLMIGSTLFAVPKSGHKGGAPAPAESILFVGGFVLPALPNASPEFVKTYYGGLEGRYFLDFQGVDFDVAYKRIMKKCTELEKLAEKCGKMYILFTENISEAFHYLLSFYMPMPFYGERNWCFRIVESMQNIVQPADKAKPVYNLFYDLGKMCFEEESGNVFYRDGVETKQAVMCLVYYEAERLIDANLKSLKESKQG